MAHIWTRSSISLMDVRHKPIYPNQPLQHYKLPSSMLVYAYGGTANVQLNEAAFAMERFGLFHGGKGTVLSILPDDVTLESYMVLYKAETPLFFKRDLQRLLEQVNPFLQQFGYVPRNPVGLLSLFQQMMDSWNRRTEMNHFHTKSLFYQSVHEIYRDLENGKTKFLQPDPVISAKRYLDEHYIKPIMFQEIADMFAISNGQLTRLFKKREGSSLQEYVIQKRLNTARHHLENTNATVKEIAEGCGFINEKNLFRMFKKYYKMTPSDYRKINALSMQVYGIDNDSHRPYNKRELDRLVKSTGDGELHMLGNTRSKEMILAAAMSLMLLLSACSSSAPANTGSPDLTPAQTQVQTTSTTETKETENAAQTRIIHTIKGDVEVPINPQRVVVNWYYPELFSLGIQPVALMGFVTGENVHFFDQAAGIPTMNYDNWDVETIMSYDPDLIISIAEDEFTANNYEKLSKVAPVIAISSGLAPAERLNFIGEVFGKQQEAQNLVDEFNAKLASLKQQLKEHALDSKTVSVFQDWAEWGFNAETAKRGASLLYTYLELTMPEEFERLVGEGGAAISYEAVPKYTGDYVVYVNHDSDFANSEIWKSIDAVKNNQVLYMEEKDQDVMLFDDVESMSAQIDYFTTHLFHLE
ncbi:helix-turn-helix domain-containing protein [Cohnella cellulosilytica]